MTEATEVKTDPEVKRRTERRKLRETNITTLQIEEAKSPGAPTFISGLCQRVDVLNKNKRRYPENVWERVLGNETHFMDRLRERRVVGMLEHPEEGKGTHTARISHVMTGMWRDGDVIKGRWEIIPTPDGKILETLVRRNIPVGVSSRGDGSVDIDEETEEEVVQDDFDDTETLTFDIVSDPSTEGSFVEIAESVRKQYQTSKTPEDGGGSKRGGVHRMLSEVREKLGELKVQVKQPITEARRSELLSTCNSILGDVAKSRTEENEGEALDIIGQVNTLTKEITQAKADVPVPPSRRSRRPPEVDEALKKRKAEAAKTVRDYIKQLEDKNKELEESIAKGKHPVIVELVKRCKDALAAAEKQEARYKACKSILKEVVEKVKDGRLESFRKRKLRDDPELADMRSFTEAKSITEAKRVVEDLKTLKGKVPLPPTVPPVGDEGRPQPKEAKPIRESQVRSDSDVIKGLVGSLQESV